MLNLNTVEFITSTNEVVNGITVRTDIDVVETSLGGTVIKAVALTSIDELIVYFTKLKERIAKHGHGYELTTEGNKVTITVV